MVFEVAMAFNNCWSSRNRQQVMKPWHLKKTTAFNNGWSSVGRQQMIEQCCLNWPWCSTMVGAVPAASR
jgi:hypothetical protein